MKAGYKLPSKRDGVKGMVEFQMLQRGRVGSNTNTLTVKALQREVGEMKQQTGTMTTGQVIDDHTAPMTWEGQKIRKRTARAKCDPRCEICAQTRGIARHPRQTEQEDFDFAMITSTECPVISNTLIVASDTGGETFVRRIPRKGEHVTRFLEVMKSWVSQARQATDWKSVITAKTFDFDRSGDPERNMDNRDATAPAPRIKGTHKYYPSGPELKETAAGEPQLIDRTSGASGAFGRTFALPRVVAKQGHHFTLLALSHADGGQPS